MSFTFVYRVLRVMAARSRCFYTIPSQLPEPSTGTYYSQVFWHQPIRYWTVTKSSKVFALIQIAQWLSTGLSTERSMVLFSDLKVHFNHLHCFCFCLSCKIYNQGWINRVVQRFFQTKCVIKIYLFGTILKNSYFPRRSYMSNIRFYSTLYPIIIFSLCVCLSVLFVKNSTGR